jgi:hypothetical protein
MGDLAGSNGVVDHGSSRFGRWLRLRRNRIALGIAAVEALIVAIASNISSWTVVVLAIIAVALFFAAGRNTKSDSFYQLTWIFAVSQLLAVIAALIALFFSLFALVLVAVFVLAALWFFFSERR